MYQPCGETTANGSSTCRMDVTFGIVLESIEVVLQFGMGIAIVVSHVRVVPAEAATALEPKRLRFFETFGVKFRLFSVGQTNLTR